MHAQERITHTHASIHSPLHLSHPQTHTHSPYILVTTRVYTAETQSNVSGLLPEDKSMAGGAAAPNAQEAESAGQAIR